MKAISPITYGSEYEDPEALMRAMRSELANSLSASVSPEPGDFAVVAYKAPGWGARLIGWFTRSKWTHAFIYMGDGKIAEAQRSGFTINELAAYDDAELLWSTDRYVISTRERDQICAAARCLIGVPYGWIDIVCIVLSAVGITPAPVMDRLAAHSTVICSQAVVHCWAVADLNLFPDKADARVTPRDLGDLLLGRPIEANA